MYEARTKASSFVKWTVASAQAAENVATADKAHTFFKLRSTFKQWGARCSQAVVERKIVEMAGRRRTSELKAAMTGGYEDLRLAHPNQRGAMPQHRVSSTAPRSPNSKKGKTSASSQAR